MCFYVISKSACLWTRIIALWAFVWFLPTLFISYDLCICMIDALPLFCKSRLGGECDLCCFFYGYSQPCCSLLEASSINKLVHSLAGAFLSVQPDQMNNSEHSCTFSPVWMITDQVAPQLSWLTKWLTTFWASVVLHSCAFSESQPHQMTYCIGHNCMLFLCCEWLRLCISSHLLLDWMIEHLCILPPLLASVCLSILILFCSDQEH